MSGTNAEQLAQPIYACASGAWFWRNGNGDINPLAEADQFLEVTRKINPPAKGIDKRFEYLKRAYAAFDIADAQSRIANQRTILTKAGLITA